MSGHGHAAGSGNVEDPTRQGELDRRRQARREVVLDALAAGLDYGEAGALGQCSARTVRRLASDSAFAAELANRRAHHVLQLTGRLANGADQAVRTLLQLLDADNDSVRLRAATAVLTVSERMRLSTDIDVRLAEQERRISQLGYPGDDDIHDLEDDDEL